MIKPIIVTASIISGLILLTGFSYLNYTAQNQTAPTQNSKFLQYLTSTGYTSAPTSQMNYKWYVYAKEWPETECETKHCNQANLEHGVWNQHGLWPSDYDWKRLEKCPKEKFNYSLFSDDLKQRVKLFWDGLYAPDAIFLSHEWNAHGTCWNPNQGDTEKMPENVKKIINYARALHRQGKSIQTAFFEVVYELHRLYKYEAVLAKHDIVPSYKPYDMNAIKAAFETEFKISKYTMSCKTDKNHHSLLGEVRICLDLDYQPTDCSYNSQHCREGDVYYKPLRS